MITNNIRVLINDTTNAIKAYLWQPTITAAYVKTVFPAKDANFADPDLVQAVIVDGTNTISPGQVSLKIDGVSVGTATVSRSAPQTTITYKPRSAFRAEIPAHGGSAICRWHEPGKPDMAIQGGRLYKRQAA